jgi:threonine dehydrogenase-like Zn-dependent dehydrogenase
MRALVLDGQVEYRERQPAPTPADGEVLVRVVCAGICETDLQLAKGYMGFRGILGHEFVGVAESGPLAGRRVVGEINCSCWRCDTCRAGLTSHCPNRTVLGILNHDGAFADLIAVPQRNLHFVPDSIPNDIAVFTEPVAAAFQVPAQLHFRRDDRVIVLGDGRLGNLCAQVVAGLANHVLVVGKHPEKLELLKRRGIATALLSELDGDRSADVVIECTGSVTGLPTALRLARPRGTIVLKTTVAGEQTMAMAPFVIGEVKLVGSRCGPFGQALAALEHGRVDVRPLIAERYDLSKGLAAFNRAQAKGVLKVLIDVAPD